VAILSAYPPIGVVPAENTPKSHAVHADDDDL
jgi:hypothetical protein